MLTDWRVQIVRRPDSKAPLRVTTWVRDSVPTGRVFRDYTLADETGTELVCAESRLVLFDLRAQKIIRIDQPRFRSYQPEARGVFASAAPRLRAPAAFDGEKTLPLRRSDIDFNGHVHNTKYLDFALEALPDSVPRDAFTGIRMIYPKAVKDANSVTLKYTLTDTGPSCASTARTRSARSSASRHEHTPAALFAAGVCSAFREPVDICAHFLPRVDAVHACDERALSSYVSAENFVSACWLCTSAMPSPTGMAGCMPVSCKGSTFLCVRFRSGCSLTIVWHRWENRMHQPRSSTCRAA